MEMQQVVPIALVGAASGFGLYCLSCAWHVWRSRNKIGRGFEDRDHPATRWARRIAAVLFLSGGVCLVLAAAAELAATSQGLLHGEGLFTVRPPKDLQVEWTTPKSSANNGEVVARFGSPERRAEIEVVRLELEELRAKRAVLAKRPLELDAEITRQLLDAASDRRHLQASLDALEIEQRAVQRQLSQERLAKEHEINGLFVTVGQLEREFDQASSTLEFNEKQLRRSSQLVSTHATSQTEHDQWTRDLKLAQDEVGKLQEQLSNTAAQKANLERGLAEFTELMEAQSASFSRQINTLATRLEKVISDEQSRTQRLQTDLARASQLRERELQQLDVQLRQTEGKLTGLVGSMQETAPFSGQVVYRAPSPRMAREEEPLLVLGRQEGLRLRLRVPVWHKAALERATAVNLELASPKNNSGESERHFVERRFTGRFSSWRELPHDAWYGLAELACTPPPDAVWYLADGGEVLVRPCWWPWLVSNPGFCLGLILAALGVAGWSVAAASRRKASPTQKSLLDIETKADERLLGEYGAEGAMLHLLGTQLREALARHRIDRHLIVATEWALDRHRARAIRLISAGMKEDYETHGHLQRLVQDSRLAEVNGTNGVPRRADLRRLLLVVQAIASEELEPQVKRLLHELDAPVFHVDRQLRVSPLETTHPQ
jgi:hypothetical protein